MRTDKRVRSALNGSPVFYLDGKRFVGYDAQYYLTSNCGFSSAEAVAYLISLKEDA